MLLAMGGSDKEKSERMNIAQEVYGSSAMSLDPILRIHRMPDSFVTFHQFRDGELVNDCAVKVSELNGIFPQFLGELERDFYFSLNSFGAGYMHSGILGLPRAIRLKKTARYLNMVFVDLDHYKLGIESGTMIGHMIVMQDEGLIPPMTGIICSGQGTWPLWALVEQHDGSDRPPNAYPSRQLLWKNIELELIRRFSDYSPDTKVNDVTRFARVPGSINTKNDHRTEYIWLTFDGSSRAYTMEQLAEFLKLPLPTKRPVSQCDPAISRRAKQAHDDAASMRLDDFLRLLRMRGHGLDDGCRNFGAMTYAWLLHSCTYSDETIEHQVRTLGRNCRPPLPDKRIAAAVKSGKEIKRMRDAKIAAELKVTDAEARYIPRFWRGGIPPEVPRVAPTPPERRAHIMDIVRTSDRRLSLQDIVTLLAFRGIQTSKYTVSVDRRALFGSRKSPQSVHVQATLPLLTGT